MKRIAILFLLTGLFLTANLFAQEKKKDTLFSSATFSGFQFRSIGPAFKSGRIADIAVHPENHNIWYVAVGSGGVWKTVNAGTTWVPIFENQPVYSIGCVTIDPNNPHTVWVGTGENVGGRHVGFGDGIYRSTDDGATWKNMGLKESQHISKIIVHPENSDIIWVAAQGPLWNKGDERGLYKSTDGGKTWKKTLGDEQWTGVTDIMLDPRNPDRIYA
ncbi:MAG: glycosyl hydrolase, partial [Bacteroidetes bacterium]